MSNTQQQMVAELVCKFQHPIVAEERRDLVSTLAFILTMLTLRNDQRKSGPQSSSASSTSESSPESSPGPSPRSCVATRKFEAGAGADMAMTICRDQRYSPRGAAATVRRHCPKLALQDSAKDGERVSRFHSKCLPTVTIAQFLARVAKYSLCSNEAMVLALIYIDRLISLDDTNGGESVVLVDSLSIHRLLVTSVLVAAKYYDDVYFNNARYAEIAGISVKELNMLEIDFVFRIKFDLSVNEETFRAYSEKIREKSVVLLGSRPTVATSPRGCLHTHAVFSHLPVSCSPELESISPCSSSTSTVESTATMVAVPILGLPVPVAYYHPHAIPVQASHTGVHRKSSAAPIAFDFPKVALRTAAPPARATATAMPRMIPARGHDINDYAQMKTHQCGSHSAQYQPRCHPAVPQYNCGSVAAQGYAQAYPSAVPLAATAQVPVPVDGSAMSGIHGGFYGAPVPCVPTQQVYLVQHGYHRYAPRGASQRVHGRHAARW